jgi:hypothetical protein
VSSRFAGHNSRDDALRVLPVFTSPRNVGLIAERRSLN